MKLYRNAEEKIGKIGKVMSIIKSSAIDCFLNKEGNSYLGNKWNKPIEENSIIKQLVQIIRKRL